jgi:hypothetical protein
MRAAAIAIVQIAWPRCDDRLSRDLHLRATPVHVALPYIACDLPLVQRRPTLVSQREIQEIFRVNLAREMGIGPPRGDHGPNPGAAWTIYIQSIISESTEGRGLAAVDDLLRSNHSSTRLSLMPVLRSSNTRSRIGIDARRKRGDEPSASRATRVGHRHEREGVLSSPLHTRGHVHERGRGLSSEDRTCLAHPASGGRL